MYIHFQITFTGKIKSTFMEWLLGEEVDRWRIVYAHNFAGFDVYPVLGYFFSCAMSPQFLFRGQKCLQIVYKPCKLIFRCSLNFFPFPDFTKAFGLNCSKGYLPFSLNTDKSQNYVGEFPDLVLFEPNSCTPAKAAKLKEWWMQKREKYIEKGKQYNFLDKMKKYCQNDVKLLRQGCELYHVSTVKLMGLDPLVSAVTGAQAINQVYRMNFVPKNAIAIVSNHGFNCMLF
ncbi:DNA polymerase [Pseudoalteromonas sp.]|uniref:DNA polymerase n=1 Tax=Pseudoalteromonas sp. TaxID=53249 RepID=UPI0026237F43|nr:DNA polymerase [Pseudoalteromonas sp.]MCP4587818.1 hypothetical protein [Pseudoalteromonas sp.]